MLPGRRQRQKATQASSHNNSCTFPCRMHRCRDAVGKQPLQPLGANACRLYLQALQRVQRRPPLAQRLLSQRCRRLGVVGVHVAAQRAASAGAGIIRRTRQAAQLLRCSRADLVPSGRARHRAARRVCARPWQSSGCVPNTSHEMRCAHHSWPISMAARSCFTLPGCSCEAAPAECDRSRPGRAPRAVADGQLRRWASLAQLQGPHACPVP